MDYFHNFIVYSYSRSQRISEFSKRSKEIPINQIEKRY